MVAATNLKNGVALSLAMAVILVPTVILSLLLRGYLELRLLRKAQHTDTAQDAAWDAAWDMAVDSDALDVDAPRQTPDDAPASGQKQGPTTLEEEEHL